MTGPHTKSSHASKPDKKPRDEALEDALEEGLGRLFRAPTRSAPPNRPRQRRTVTSAARAEVPAGAPASEQIMFIFNGLSSVTAFEPEMINHIF